MPVVCCHFWLTILAFSHLVFALVQRSLGFAFHLASPSLSASQRPQRSHMFPTCRNCRYRLTSVTAELLMLGRRFQSDFNPLQKWPQIAKPDNSIKYLLAAYLTGKFYELDQVLQSIAIGGSHVESDVRKPHLFPYVSKPSPHSSANSGYFDDRRRCVSWRVGATRSWSSSRRS